MSCHVEFRESNEGSYSVRYVNGLGMSSNKNGRWSIDMKTPITIGIGPFLRLVLRNSEKGFDVKGNQITHISDKYMNSQLVN